MFCGFSSGVRVVTGVIAHLGELGVKVNSKRSACVKKQLDYWIFHSSLFVIHSSLLCRRICAPSELSIRIS